MVYIIIAAALLIALFGWCFFVNSFSISKDNARLCKNILLAAGITGVVLCSVSAVLFFVLLENSKADNTVKNVISDCYLLYIAVDGIFILVGLVITLLSSILKSKLRPVIPVVLPMWAVISFFWTLLCLIWSEFADFNASFFVIVFGIGAAMLLAFSALPQTCEREVFLSDRKNRDSIIKKRNEKSSRRKEKRESRRKLNEKKKRLKNPKRK